MFGMNGDKASIIGAKVTKTIIIPFLRTEKMIADVLVEEAVAAARESMGGDNDAQLLYLMGNAYMKQGLRKEAMNA